MPNRSTYPSNAAYNQSLRDYRAAHRDTVRGITRRAMQRLRARRKNERIGGEGV